MLHHYRRNTIFFEIGMLLSVVSVFLEMSIDEKRREK